MRKNDFLEPEKLFFDCLAYGIGSQDPIAQLVACWAKDLGSGAQFLALSFGPGFLVNNVPGPDWKHSKHARKKQFFGAWKIDFLQSLSFLQVIKENNISDPQVYPHIDFVWIGSSPSMREKKRAWKVVFLQKPDIIP